MQTLQEVYWSAPGALLEAGAATLMCSYAQVNGVPACEYKPLFDTVRRLYNSSVIVVSDWGATHSTESSIVAEMDLEMPTGTWYGSILYNSIYVARNLSETYLDRAVGHTLDKFERFGMLDRGDVSADTVSLPNWVVEEDARIAYEIAVKSGVLLKNDNAVLPVKGSASIAVIGPNGLQYSHGTNFAERAYGVPSRQVSPIDALRNRTGRDDIPTAVGVDQEGTLIPASALTSLNNTQGLSRNDSSGGHSLDSHINFSGETELPANRSYEWQGYLVAPTSGYYTISLQRKMPKLVGHTSKDYGSVFSIGGISINGSLVAAGYHGWDNIKAYVYLSAGRHLFSANIFGLLQQPTSVRLCWVTPRQREKNIQYAVSIAKSVKTPMVFAFANSPAQKGLTLDDGQGALITQVAAANPRTVVVLNNAEPVLMPWLKSVASVLKMGYAGQEGGWATVDLLLGLRSPQGRLPVTYPSSLNQTVTRSPDHPERVATESGNATFSEGVNAGYRWYKHTNTPVLFPFGYGMTYTSFEYSHLDVNRARSHQISDFSDKGTFFTVSFDITNVGHRAGVEVPQIYIGAPQNAEKRYPGVQFPATALVGFENVEFPAGQGRRIRIDVDKKQLEYFSVAEGRFNIAQGVREVRVGKSVDDIDLVGSVEI